jgi:phytanoyl-CoA hydroxylase
MKNAKQNLSLLRTEYDHEGLTIARNVIDTDLVEEGRQHIDWLAKKNPDLRPEQLGHTLMTHDAFWVRLISDDRLLDVAEQFIGPNIALFASHYIAKPPHDGQPVLWHQDGSYWPLEPMEVVTLWLSLDHSDAENGCMRFIPRTQHMDLKEMKKRTDVASVLASGMDESLVEEDKAKDIILAPGDVSIHHPNVIHGSNANTSPRWRRGLTIRYIPASTRIITREGKSWPSAFLLRGTAVPGVNDYQPRPTFSEETSIKFRGCETWS